MVQFTDLVQLMWSLNPQYGCVVLSIFASNSEVPINHMVQFTDLVQLMWFLNPWYRCVVLSIFASNSEMCP